MLLLIIPETLDKCLAQAENLDWLRADQDVIAFEDLGSNPTADGFETGNSGAGGGRFPFRGLCLDGASGDGPRPRQEARPRASWPAVCPARAKAARDR